jgi:hypothetical protein
MAKLVNAYPDGDGGRPVTGKLRSPEDWDHNQRGEPPAFPSHRPCPSEYTPAGSKFIESPTVPEYSVVTLPDATTTMLYFVPLVLDEPSHWTY